MQKSWESQVLSRGLTIVCSEGNKRLVRWGFYKGIDKLVYSTTSLITHIQMNQGVSNTTEQVVGSVKPSQSNNLSLSQAQLMACLDVKKRKGSRVEGRRVIQLSCLKVF